MDDGIRNKAIFITDVFKNVVPYNEGDNSLDNFRITLDGNCNYDVIIGIAKEVVNYLFKVANGIH